MWVLVPFLQLNNLFFGHNDTFVIQTVIVILYKNMIYESVDLFSVV